VFVAVANGETAYGGTGKSDHDLANDPNTSDNWDQERQVRARLLRWLCANEDASQADRRGIRVHGAPLLEKLDISRKGSAIKNGVQLRDAQIEGEDSKVL